MLKTNFFLQAELLDAAAGINVRFRLGGVSMNTFLFSSIKAHLYEI